VRDVLGLDLTFPPDAIIDSFFVDPGYLKRNTISNGVNAGFLALAPPVPTPVFSPADAGIHVEMIGADTIYRNYRLAIRSKGSGSLYFDTIYTFTDTTSFQVTGLTQDKEYYFSVMNVNNGFESMPCPEFTQVTVGVGHLPDFYRINMSQNYPNPFREQTSITVWSDQSMANDDSEVIIKDTSGREISRLPIVLTGGKNTITYTKYPGMSGVFTFSLFLKGQLIQTKKMVVF